MINNPHNEQCRTLVNVYQKGVKNVTPTAASIFEESYLQNPIRVGTPEGCAIVAPTQHAMGWLLNARDMIEKLYKQHDEEAQPSLLNNEYMRQVARARSGLPVQYDKLRAAYSDDQLLIKVAILQEMEKTHDTLRGLVELTKD